jgi:hypothetical protein
MFHYFLNYYLVLVHKTSLTPPLFIEVPWLSQEYMCVCVGSIYFTSVSTIFDWISEAVLTVWIFYSFYFSTCICVLGYPCICVLGYPFYLCLRFSIGFWELFRQSYFLFYNVNLLIGFHFITELFFSLNLYNIYAPFYQKRTVGYSVC